MRNYIINGCAIVDKVLDGKGGRLLRSSLGGGAIYAMTGIKLWNGECTLVCYSGKDFSDYYGEWMNENGFSSQGVVGRFEKTNVCELYYLPNGTHTMGEGVSEYCTGSGDRVDAELLKEYLKGDVSNTALHLVTGYIDNVLQYLQPYRKNGLLVGYEIDPEDTSFPDIRNDIPRICRNYVDFFSISCAELQDIFPEITSIEMAVDYCVSLNIPTFLRAGEEGAYMIQNGEICHSPMISVFGNEDPTGCGNSSTAAAFLAFCEGKSTEEAAMMGAVTAALNAGYKGPINKITPELQKQCADLVQKILDKWRRLYGRSN